MNIVVLDTALFYLNSIRSYRRVGNCGADYLRSTIQGCTLGLKLEHRILITILTVVTLGTNYYGICLDYSQVTLLITDFIVLSIGTANCNGILCWSARFICFTREGWLFGQNRLIRTILKASITCLEHWHCITLLLGVIASGDGQWSLGNHKTT